MVRARDVIRPLPMLLAIIVASTTQAALTADCFAKLEEVVEKKMQDELYMMMGTTANPNPWVGYCDTSTDKFNQTLQTVPSWVEANYGGTLGECWDATVAQDIVGALCALESDGCSKFTHTDVCNQQASWNGFTNTCPSPTSLSEVYAFCADGGANATVAGETEVTLPAACSRPYVWDVASVRQCELQRQIQTCPPSTIARCHNATITSYGMDQTATMCANGEYSYIGMETFISGIRTCAEDTGCEWRAIGSHISELCNMVQSGGGTCSEAFPLGTGFVKIPSLSPTVRFLIAPAGACDAPEIAGIDQAWCQNVTTMSLPEEVPESLRREYTVFTNRDAPGVSGVYKMLDSGNLQTRSEDTECDFGEYLASMYGTEMPVGQGY